jgi:DNA polymerase I
MPKTLYIIDSHSHLYASYYAIPNLRAPDGEPTGAVYGFTAAVLKILREKAPDRMVAVFDAPGDVFRKKQYADYKATRKPMPEDLVPQIDRAKEIMAALGVTTVAAPGYEADDLVAKFTAEARADDCDVVIVSRDKDLMQLLGPGVVMVDSRNDTIMDEARLKETRGITPEQLIDMLGLMGDAVDNIPGVPGIGEKRAVKLLQDYGSLDEVLAHADEIKGKMGESIRDNAELARLSRQLATLEPNVPVDVTFADLTLGRPDHEKLNALFTRLAFRRLIEEFPIVNASETEAERAAKDFRLVNTPAALKKLASRLKRAEGFAFDTETTGLNALVDRLVGLSFSTAEGEGDYVPVRGPEGELVLDIATVGRVLGPVLASPANLKVAHNAKFDIAVLHAAGLELGGPIFDTMIASYLLDSGSRHHKLDDLSKEQLHYAPVPITDLIGEKKRGLQQKRMDEVPLAEIAPYAAEDAEVAWRLYREFEPRLEAEGLAELFRDVEMPLVRCLEQMERNGVAVDVDLLKKLSGKLGRRMDALEVEIYADAGREFNIGSPKQLEVILFDELELKPLRKTKTGRSTDANTLAALAGKHTVPAKVLEYRMLSKLKGTYIDALPLLVNKATNRIHASFNQAVTATGRLSSSHPNLQNIPIRGEQGREIREAFVPGDRPGDVLLTADYSQIELRLLAHFSQDPFLLDAFARDLDIHAFVASEIFDVPQNEVTGEQRSRAKTINFSLIYGKTAYGLARDMAVSVGEAARFIEAYFARYTRVREFMVRVLTAAQKDEMVTTILGRRRRTPGIKHTDGSRWNNPERAAFNTVLQGSAADMIKVAMNNIQGRIERESRPSRMILQVHDELVFEVPADAVADAQTMIVDEMVGAIPLIVPMKVNVAVGSNWLEAK